MCNALFLFLLDWTLAQSFLGLVNQTAFSKLEQAPEQFLLAGIVVMSVRSRPLSFSSLFLSAVFLFWCCSSRPSSFSCLYGHYQGNMGNDQLAGLSAQARSHMCVYNINLDINTLSPWGLRSRLAAPVWNIQSCHSETILGSCVTG